MIRKLNINPITQNNNIEKIQINKNYEYQNRILLEKKSNLVENAQKLYQQLNHTSYDIRDAMIIFANTDRIKNFLFHQVGSVQQNNISKVQIEKRRKIHRVKLNYMPAVSHTEPVAKISVPASHLEALDRVIKEKCEQNARAYIAGEAKAKEYIVR